jgi:hypothetical protein
MIQWAYAMLNGTIAGLRDGCGCISIVCLSRRVLSWYRAPFWHLSLTCVLLCVKKVRRLTGCGVGRTYSEGRPLLSRYETIGRSHNMVKRPYTQSAVTITISPSAPHLSGAGSIVSTTCSWIWVRSVRPPLRGSFWAEYRL